MPFELTKDREQKLAEILTRYPTKMAALIPLLHLCQEQNGFISEDVMSFCAHKLDVAPAHVEGVVTFYTLFNRTPVGKHQVWVCRTLPCALRGADAFAEAVSKELGIDFGETTKDGKFTLKNAECMAACDKAPVCQINALYHENLTPSKLKEILGALP